jgi:uncharacterized protein (DUF1800 family)
MSELRDESLEHQEGDLDRASCVRPNDEAVRRAAVPAALFGSTLLAACGGGGGASAPSPATGAVPGPAPGTPPAPPPASPPSTTPPDFSLDAADVAAARLLLHAGIGATDEDIASVKARGAAAWLADQMAMPIGERAYDWLLRRGYAVHDENKFIFHDFPADFAIAQQLVKAPDIVRKRVALALSEYFVVSLIGLETLAWRCFAAAHHWDQLNEGAFGNFRTLLENVTLNLAMGKYLSTLFNGREIPEIGRVPDENYAREVMQLFTIGLHQLNLDGTAKRDAAGQVLPTYTADDVTNLARVFTGYEWYDDGVRWVDPTGFEHRGSPEYARRPMPNNARQHSPLEKRFLGTTIPAATGASESLRIALDTLFNHPNVGPFFGRQMIQRLVTSNPSPAYVARVATKFNDNGSGVRGDLKAVWAAILLDEEARGGMGLTSPTFGKLREPMVRLFQWARTFGVDSTRGSWKWSFNVEDAKTWFGQRPLYAPSVFNFFRPGYVPPSTALAQMGATAPEFQITSESTVSQWINMIESIALNGIFVTLPDRPGFPNPWMGPYPTDGYDITTRYQAEMAISHDAVALVRRLNLLLCAGQLSVQTQTRIVTALQRVAVTEASPESAKRMRIAQAIVLVMICPEYIVQK